MDLNKKSSIDHIWQPLEGLGASSANQRLVAHSALIILNQKSRPEMDTKLDRLWSNVALKFCVDGGANRLYQWCQRLGRDPLDYLPDVICGDLDSIDPHVRKFYESQNRIQFVLLSNQDLTDFTKTLRLVIKCIGRGEFDEDLFRDTPGVFESLRQSRYARVGRIECVYCVGEFSGRVDHSLANLHSLYDSSVSGREAYVRVYMIASDSLTFLLKQGANLIAFDRHRDDNDLIGPYCGFFPLGEPALARTRGFRWNLNGDVPLSFPSFVSSSNEFETPFDVEKIAEVCHLPTNDLTLFKCAFIETDRPLLFTMSLK